MNPSREFNAALDTIAKILIRCFWMGIGLLALWFFAWLIGAELGYKIHASLFEVTKEQCIAVSYAGIIYLKLFVFTCFLLPYIAIRLVLAK